MKILLTGAKRNGATITLEKSATSHSAKPLWVSLNENKKEDAENPLKSRQQF